MCDVLLILGASVRAAATSAVRAGFHPFGGDVFADQDLRCLGPAIRVEDYPDDLAAVASIAPPGPWMYTGGLENHPELVDRIAEQRQLLGNPGHVLTAVRDPFQVFDVLRRADLSCPAVFRTRNGVPHDGLWLRKPYRGSGGNGIAHYDPAATIAGAERSAEKPHSPRHYFQQWIDGTSHAALYVAAQGRSVLLGVTEQLVGSAEMGARPFQYSGSLGPLSLSIALREQFERIGRTLAAAFGLVGLFGIDAVIAEGTVWPVEVNPRYTASVEVLERGCDFAAVRHHADACLSGILPRSPVDERRCWAGKAVVYARRDLTVPASLPRLASAGASHFADIPAAGSSIYAGQPVITVLVEARERQSVLGSLHDGVQAVERLLYG